MFLELSKCFKSRCGGGRVGELRRATSDYTQVGKLLGADHPFRRPYGRFRFVVSKPRDAIPQDIHERARGGDK